MEIIGSCGLICSDCPAFIAFQTDNEELRKKSAREWSKMYQADIKPEDMNCTGCRQPGVKFNHCMECPVRLCAIKKKVKNCSLCELYSCSTLDKFLEYIPQARKKLEELRNS